MRQHQRGAARGLDHLGHGEGLTGAGDAQQNLVLIAVAQTAQQRVDSGGLVAFRLIVDPEPEGHVSL